MNENPPTLTTRELIEIAFRQLGFQPKVSAINRLMLTVVSLFIPAAGELIEMMYEFEKPYIVDDSKFKRTFGDISTPHETGIQRTLAWYKQHLATGQA
jgi:nucleoside-diphosphate-sugar epimerase